MCSSLSGQWTVLSSTSSLLRVLPRLAAALKMPGTVTFPDWSRGPFANSAGLSPRLSQDGVGLEALCVTLLVVAHPCWLRYDHASDLALAGARDAGSSRCGSRSNRPGCLVPVGVSWWNVVGAGASEVTPDGGADRLVAEFPPGRGRTYKGIKLD